MNNVIQQVSMFLAVMVYHEVITVEKAVEMLVTMDKSVENDTDKDPAAMKTIIDISNRMDELLAEER